MALITVSPSLGGDKGENVEGDGKTKAHLKREPNEINRSDGHLFSGCETLSQSGKKKNKTKGKVSWKRSWSDFSSEKWPPWETTNTFSDLDLATGSESCCLHFASLMSVWLKIREALKMLLFSVISLESLKVIFFYLLWTAEITYIRWYSAQYCDSYFLSCQRATCSSPASQKANKAKLCSL